MAEKAKWGPLLKAFRLALGKVHDLNQARVSPVLDTGQLVKGGAENLGPPKKKTRRLDEGLLSGWEKFRLELVRAEKQVSATQTTFAFSFVEGALVKVRVHEGLVVLKAFSVIIP